MAKANGVETVELDGRLPFSAARARNEGFQRLMQLHPGIDYVQFLDGDCTLNPDWIETAAQALKDDSSRSAVLGDLRERNAELSRYNRLCAVEWRRESGDLKNFAGLGGISMIRCSVFQQLGGFRPEVIAGEDSELGVRMGLAGYKITKLDCLMAVHDAGLTTFGQWWKRAVRAGHAIGQRSDIHGRSRLRDSVREKNSTLFWGICLPCLILVTAPSSSGTSLLLIFAYPILAARIWRRQRVYGDSASDALLYATFTVIAKFANAVGLLQFFLNKASGRYEIIEYKRPDPT